MGFNHQRAFPNFLQTKMALMSVALPISRCFFFANQNVTSKFSSIKIRLDAYFLAPQKNRPGLFGIPVIVPCTSQTRQCDLYEGVWIQVARLLSPPAPGDTNCKDG